MPDRTVSYEFRAKYSQFTAGLGAMGKSVTDTAGKLTALDRNGQRMRAGLTSVGDTAGKVGLVFAAGVAVAVGAAANFEQAMSNVQAATHETSENMATLRQAALDAGQATQYSATEAAGAIEELSKAGVSTADILGGGLSGALDLAAAGGLEVADAAEIAASALVQFGLSGEEVPHVADLLAAGAGKAQGSVQDLGYALKYAGVPAASLGISIEETTGVLAEFASAGIVGEQAGTTLRSLLLSLAAPTQKANVLLDEYGITLYDSAGKFVGLESAAQQLNEKLGGLSEAQRNAALNTIFGTSAIQGAIQLYEGGGKAVADWTGKVDDQGYAAETAAIKMDNLKGDLEQFTGALETAFIGAGGGAQGPLRDLVQGATDVVNKLNKLPPAAQDSALALAGITAVTGGALWFGSKVVQAVAGTRQALYDLGIIADRTSGSLGKMATAGLKLGGLAATISTIGQAVAEAAGANVDIEDLDRQINAIANGDSAELLDQISNSLGVMSSRTGAIGGTAEAVNELVTAFGVFGGTAADNAADNVDKVDKALAAMVESGNAETAAKFFDQLAAAQLGVLPGSSISDDALKELMGDFSSYETALRNAETASDDTAGATDGLANAQAQAAQAAQEQANAIAEAVEAMEKQRDAAIGAFDAITGYRQAMKDATAQAKTNREGIAGNSEAALKNRGALSSLAAAWNNQSASVTGNIKKFKEARSNFIETATAMGVPRAAAKKLANQLLEIPESRVAKISTPGVDESINKGQTLAGIIRNLRDKSITVTTRYKTLGNGPTPNKPIMLGGDSPRVGGGRRAPRSVEDSLQDAGLNTVAPRLTDLSARSTADALTVLARESGKAGGGLKALREKAERLEKAADKAEKRYDRQQSKLDELLSKQADLTSSVSGLFNINLGAEQTSSSTEAVGNPWAAGSMPAGAAQSPDLLTQINEAAIKANQYPSIIKALQAAGLTGQALSEVVSEMSFDQLQQLVANPALAGQYATSLNALNAAAGAAGASAGTAVYGGDVAEQTKVAQESRQELKKANQRLNAIERAIERADDRADKSREKHSKDNSKDVGNRVSGGANKGKRNRVYARK